MTKPATHYHDRRSMNEALVQRLPLLSKLNATSEQINMALLYLDKELHAINTRELLLKQSRYLRIWHAWRSLIRGDYQYFNGMKSFVRDVLR